MNFLLFALFSISCFAGITLKPALEGSDRVRFEKYVQSVKHVEEVVNSVDFSKAVLAYEFTSTKDSSQQVLVKINEAAEILLPSKNNIWEWSVGFYYKRSNVVGWTNPKIMTVWVNKKFFDTAQTWGIAANIAHEYMHKIGYGHRNARDSRSVPYAVGSIVEKLVKEKLNKPESPVITPSKPRQSIWGRLKSFLGSIL